MSESYQFCDNQLSDGMSCNVEHCSVTDFPFVLNNYDKVLGFCSLECLLLWLSAEINLEKAKRETEK